MSISFQINEKILASIHEDLSRPHSFAFERVGFITCSSQMDKEKNLIIESKSYHPVKDEHYIDDPNYGALIGADAFRMALEQSYNQNASIIHIHRHEHRGRPRFSRTDNQESNKFIPSFINIKPLLPHATVVLSYDSMSGRCWLPNTEQPVPINNFIITKPSARLGVFA